jgi:zinc protease
MRDTIRMPRQIAARAGLLSLFLLTFLLGFARPETAGAQAAKAGDLHYPPLPAQEIPRPERVVLDNGMVVMLLEDHELPLVEAIALVHAGTRLDPAGKTGLAEITADVMRSGGTTKRTSDQLDDFLEGKAARIETMFADEYVRVSMSSLKADFPQVLGAYADVLRHPVFAENPLAVALAQARAQVARQNDDPGEILFREFKRVAYGKDSPYGWTPTFASLGSLTRADLVAWHQAHFQPQGIVLGLVGDFKRDEALRLVQEAFGDWPRGAAAKDAAVPFRTTPAPGVYYIEKNDVTQSNIIMGGLGIEKNSPDYYANEVVNQVLSGSFASRLFAIRAQQGLAYTVFGRVSAEWDHPGLTFLFISTKTETTGAAIDALLAEARGMTAKPPTEEEVAKGKQGILNSFIFQADSKRKILTQQLNYEFFGYPLDWLTRYRAGIEAVTTAQVRAVAAKYIHPEQFAIVVVGPAKGTDKPLSTYGTVTPIDVTIERPKAGPQANPKPGS